MSCALISFKACFFYFKKEDEIFKKSCKFCCKMHNEDYKWDKKPIKRKKIDDIGRFKNSPK